MSKIFSNSSSLNLRIFNSSNNISREFNSNNLKQLLLDSWIRTSNLTCNHRKLKIPHNSHNNNSQFITCLLLPQLVLNISLLVISLITVTKLLHHHLHLLIERLKINALIILINVQFYSLLLLFLNKHFKKSFMLSCFCLSWVSKLSSISNWQRNSYE